MAGKVYARIARLGELLEEGYARREAAELLSEEDPDVGFRYAMTLVYQWYSGSEYSRPERDKKRGPKKGTKYRGRKGEEKEPEPKDEELDTDDFVF